MLLPSWVNLGLFYSSSFAFPVSSRSRMGGEDHNQTARAVSVLSNDSSFSIAITLSGH